MEGENTSSIGKGSYKARLVVLGVFLLAVTATFYLSVSRPFFVGKSYSQIYTLVEDKVSQSAAVIINLPKGVPTMGAEKLISFEPALAGKFVSVGESKNSLAFVPEKPLVIDKRYTVRLLVGEGNISKDFVIVEDPKVLEVFPKNDSEADEHSSITIMFNRPMVPLTAISTLESKNLHVQIIPATEGKYKWISTRVLQFIPKDRLAYSARYSVKILEGFASTDGVPVPPAEYTFTTRPLRHLNSSEGTIMYNEPIEIRFNVPINLDRTVPGLTLKNISTGVLEPFVAEYGKRYEYDAKGKPRKVIVDRSVLSIYPKSDRNGRSRIWDFGGAYSATLRGAYPLDGDISLPNLIQTEVSVTSAIKSLTVFSPRTNLASDRLFDPQGSIRVGFFEEIDLRKSEIVMEGLKEVHYVKSCKPAENIYGRYEADDTCEKVDDKREIELTFDQYAFTKGQSIPLQFEKIVNVEGLTINSKPITESITVFPELKIFSITPTSGATSASLSDLYVCTNSPLKKFDAKNYRQFIKTDSYLIFNRIDQPYVRQVDPPGYPSDVPCKPGEFVNAVRYGLHPETHYAFSLSFEDSFGQKVSRAIQFTTGKPKQFYTRLFNLQKIYNVTTPDKTTFTYGVENLVYVDLHICKVSPAIMLSYLNTRPDPTDTNDALNCLTARTERITLPNVYWVNNYFQIDLKKYFDNPRGQYVISLSNPDYKEAHRARQLFDRAFVSVTNLAIGEKKTQWTKYDSEPEKTESSFRESGSLANLYWVSDAHSLAPVSGATVKVYTQSGNYNGPISLGGSGVTGQDGVAKMPLTKDIVGASVTIGDDSAIISSWTDNLQWASYTQSNRLIYTYTDRPIYRPGQDVHVKGLYRFQFDGRFEILQEKEISFSVYNPRGESIMSQNIPLSDFGTFVTHLKLPTEAMLGTYRMEAMNTSFYFDVAAYQGAAFEAKASADKEEYIAGDTAEISVFGKYYFGVPVVGGQLEYSWTAQDYYFDRYTDEYFNFGADWYSCQYCGYGDSYFGRGETTLDISGQAKVSKTFDFNDLFKDGGGKKSKIVVFHGTIKDLNGKSVSFQKSFIVHRGDFYLGAKAEPSFAPTNQNIAVKVKTVDVKGKPVAKSGIKLVANKVEWKSAKRQEVDGGFYSQYERVLTPVASENVSTGNTGDGTANFSFKDPGEYQINASASDSKGNQILGNAWVYVYGSGVASVQPSNNETLDVTAEKTTLNVGERAKIIIKSIYPRAKALITVERGRIFTYKIVSIDKNFFEYEVPITDEYIPNIYVSVLLLSPDPKIQFGQVMFNVNTAEKELNVKVTSNKTSYLPGEKVTLSVKTTDNKGVPQSADVSIAVADLSVLALKGNPKKDPLVFFYNGLPLTVSTASNIKNIMQVAKIPVGTKGGSGEGASASDLAKRKRGEFKDTAFWQGRVLTDANGLATVTFTLPDNLTRWQIESLGITRDTKIGVNYNEFTAAKKIMAVPLAPRFIIPDDEFSIGAQVFNQTEENQTFEVSLVSPTLTLVGNAKYSISLRAKESSTVYFKVSAPVGMATGTHTFTLSARNGNFEDTVERSIPIKRNETYESVATAGVVKGDTASEYIFIPQDVVSDRGGVTVRAQASLAFFLTNSISYMAQFPYGCSEQMASKLSTLAVLKRANATKGIGSNFPLPEIVFEGVSYKVNDAVEKGLSRIYENQTAGGGFAYYQGMQPDLALSIHMLNTLVDLKEAGFAVSNSALSRASEYVGTALLNRSGSTLYPIDTDDLIFGAYAVSRTSGATPDLANIADRISLRVTPAYLSETISSSALVNLALLIPIVPTLQHLEESVWKTIDNRIDIDSRGAYLKSKNSNIRWNYYETPVKNTAELVRTISIRKVQYAQIDSMLRWLFASRDGQGSWGSTNTTLSVIKGVVAYLDWSEEGQSEFSLAVKLDGEAVATHDFKGKSLFEALEKFLPISKFEQEKNHRLSFERTNSKTPSNFYYDIGLTYFLPVEKLPPRDEGVTVSRNYYALTDTEGLRPISEAKVGEVIRGEIRVITPKPRSLFAIESFIPAGLELIDFSLDTEDQTGIENVSGAVGLNNNVSSPFGSMFGSVAASLDTSLPQIFAENAAKEEAVSKLYPDFKELHDDRLFLFNQNLPAGEYVYNFYARVSNVGVYRSLPTVAKELYFPEIFGRTEGGLFTVVK